METNWVVDSGCLIVKNAYDAAPVKKKTAIPTHATIANSRERQRTHSAMFDEDVLYSMPYAEQPSGGRPVHSKTYMHVSSRLPPIG